MLPSSVRQRRVTSSVRRAVATWGSMTRMSMRAVQAACVCSGMWVAAMPPAQAETLGSRRPPAYSGQVQWEAAPPVSTATQVAPPADPNEPLFRDAPLSDKPASTAMVGQQPPPIKEQAPQQAPQHQAVAASRDEGRHAAATKKASARSPKSNPIVRTAASTKPKARELGGGARAVSKAQLKGRSKLARSVGTSRLARRGEGAARSAAIGAGALKPHRTAKAGKPPLRREAKVKTAATSQRMAKSAARRPARIAATGAKPTRHKTAKPGGAKPASTRGSTLALTARRQ